MTTTTCICPFASQITCCNLKHSESFSQRSTLFEDIGAYILHLKATGHAISTVICYKGYLDRLIGLLGDVETTQINARSLEHAVVQLQEKYPCSNVTGNKIRSVYRSLFQWLFASGQISGNPSALLHLARTTPKYTIPITQGEVTTLLEAIRNSNNPLAERDELIIALYAFTGIRRSEALRLRVDDYDRVAKTLRLRSTKDGGYRLQPVPTRLLPMLEQHIGHLRRGGTAFLFPGSDTHKPLSPRQAHSRFVFWKQTATIRNGLTIHSLRAGYATNLYRTSGDIWLVSQALGHIGLQTIRHYVQTDNTKIRCATERAFACA